MSSIRVIALVTLAVSCSSPSGGDAGFDAGRCGDVTPVGSCKPNLCATGNSMHVGAYCTNGGGQCNRYPYDGGALLLCSIDLDKRGDNFCIAVGCHANSDCNEKACCTGNEGTDGPFACVPLQCLVEDGGEVCPPIPHSIKDGGTDGGVDGGDGG